jgi:hypothetical protein
VRHQDAGGTIEVYVVGDPDRRRRGHRTPGLVLAFLARASQPSDSIGVRPLTFRTKPLRGARGAKGA